jgi:hypothetical protein
VSWRRGLPPPSEPASDGRAQLTDLVAGPSGWLRVLGREERSITQRVGMRCPLPNRMGAWSRVPGSERAAEEDVR